MKLKEWIAYWQEIYDRPAVRPSTYQAHGYLLKNHIVPRLGEMELTEITESIVRRFLNDCHDHGNLRRNEPLSPETMRHICVLLSGILNQAVRDGYIEKNPAQGFRYYTSKQVQAEALSEAEMEEYLDAAAELGYLPIFLLALEHGLRQRELIALKWSDLDSKRGILTIHMDRVVERRELVSYGEQTREIVLPAYTVAELQKEHEKHPSNEVMFIHPGTLKPYSPAMIRLLHQRVLKQAGLPHVRFVDLRHTYVVLALQAGKKVKEVSAELGHTRVTETKKRYKDYLPQTDQKSRPAALCAAVTAEQKKTADVLGNMLIFKEK